MEDKSKVLTANEIHTRNQNREATYLHTLETEKRHELLFAACGINFSSFRTIAYLLACPDGAAPPKLPTICSSSARA